MRARALAAGLVLVALSAVVFTAGGRGGVPGLAPPATPPAVSSIVPPRPRAMPARNVFEYAPAESPRNGPEQSRPPALVRSEPLAAVMAPAPPEPPVRLVGFVRRSGGLKAALAVGGSVYVLGEGEAAEGYVLRAVDEDAGVRISTPDGSTLTLPPPS